MSGEILLKSLKAVGYEGGSLQHLEWLFDYEGTKGFLQWLCSNISQKTILTLEEKEQFAKLKQSGATIVPVDSIPENIAQWKMSTKERLESADAIKTRVSSLKEKCESGKKELAKLRAQRDLVQQIRAEQNPRCELLKKSLDSCKKEVTEKIDALNTISSQFNQSLVSLEEQSTRLCSSVQRDRGTAAILEAYLQREEAFRVQLLSLGSTQQENKQNYQRNTKELHRIQQAHSITERQMVEAQLWLAHNRAQLDAIRMLSLSNATYFQQDATQLKNRLVEATEQVKAKSAELSDRMQKLMPPLYKDVASAVVAPALLADYDHKISRQQQHAALQEKIITHLTHQHIRHRLVAFALRKEGSLRVQAANIYTAILKDMGDLSSGCDIRRRKYELAQQFATNRPSSPEKLSSWLSALLPEAPGKSTEDRIVLLAQQLQAAKKDSIKMMQETVLSEKLATVNMMRQMVFVDGKLTLTHPQLKTAQQQLETAISALAVAMDAIIKDREAKKQLIAAEEGVSLERELFVYFFIKPEILQQLLANIKAAHQQKY